MQMQMRCDPIHSESGLTKATAHAESRSKDWRWELQVMNCICTRLEPTIAPRSNCNYARISSDLAVFDGATHAISSLNL